MKHLHSFLFDKPCTSSTTMNNKRELYNEIKYHDRYWVCDSTHMCFKPSENYSSYNRKIWYSVSCELLDSKYCGCCLQGFQKYMSLWYYNK
jgi:hypothetical protein